MAGSGRGRGRASFTFNIEAIGFSKGAVLPDVVCKPPPLFPVSIEAFFRALGVQVKCILFHLGIAMKYKNNSKDFRSVFKYFMLLLLLFLLLSLPTHLVAVVSLSNLDSLESSLWLGFLDATVIETLDFWACLKWSYTVILVFQGMNVSDLEIFFWCKHRTILDDYLVLQ